MALPLLERMDELLGVLAFISSQPGLARTGSAIFVWPRRWRSERLSQSRMRVSTDASVHATQTP